MIRKIKAKLILQLRAEGLSLRQIQAQGISGNSVTKVTRAANSTGLDWEQARQMSDHEVYERLFPGRGEHESIYQQPDWAHVHKELARVGVTLKLLHAEYLDQCHATGQPGMGYDRFCKTYTAYALRAGVSSRVGHKAGQTIEVDWAGPTMTLTNPVTKTVTKVYLFVACLPFSRYAFVWPTLDMQQDTWLEAHVVLFTWLGGSVPRIVPDNLKTGVLKHPRYGEIVLNDSYRELAAHYSAAVLPTRVRKPKDKPSVENTVWSITTWVIAALRNKTFATLADLREAVAEQVSRFNQEPFQKREGSRFSVFEDEEKALLRPLPAVPYEMSLWVYDRRVGRDAHVVWEKNHYSVPYQHIGCFVDLKITSRQVDIFLKGTRVSSHARLAEGVSGQYRTRDTDLPDGPGYREWNPERVRAWAVRTGPNTSTVINRIFESVAVEEQGLNPALAVLRLSHRYSPSRVEKACQMVLATRVRSPRYAHVAPLLETGQDIHGRKRPMFQDADEPAGFIRGAAYYAGENK